MIGVFIRVALCFAQLESGPARTAPAPVLRAPKPSLRPAGTPAIHSGARYEPTDDECADDCGAVPDRNYDECRELCAEER